MDYHLPKRALQYLYQVETESSKLHVFSIPKKELKVHELDLTFSRGIGFYHAENSFYFGGGALRNYLTYEFFSNFRKLRPTGEVTEL